MKQAIDSSELADKDLYYVAVKLFLRDNDRLLITHDIFGSWDLPGGRLRQNEFDAPLEQVIKRKIGEELGPDFEFELGEQTVFFTVERVEHDSKEKVRIFAIGYEAKYKGGKVKLGKHHDRSEWVSLSNFQPQTYFEGGWLSGVQEYMALRAST